MLVAETIHVWQNSFPVDVLNPPKIRYLHAGSKIRGSWPQFLLVDSRSLVAFSTNSHHQYRMGPSYKLVYKPHEYYRYLVRFISTINRVVEPVRQLNAILGAPSCEIVQFPSISQEFLGSLAASLAEVRRSSWNFSVHISLPRGASSGTNVLTWGSPA